MLGLAELLKNRGLDLSKKIKILRHQDKQYDVQQMLEKGQLEIYQSYHKKPILDCDYVISTIGDESTKALFYNVYQVTGKKKAKETEVTGDDIIQNMILSMIEKDGWYYDLQKIEGFEDLSKRVVIEWDGVALSWHRWFNEENDKIVIEILPEGYVKDFPGFDNVIISFKQLEGIIKNPDANKEWKRILASVSGVYLILDTLTGNQYIGSAYGENGIWGRWSKYVTDGSGGNKKLIDLIKDNEDYKYNFQFSLLKTLPTSTLPMDVIEFEKIFKDKLGSRAFGLNLN